MSCSSARRTRKRLDFLIPSRQSVREKTLRDFFTGKTSASKLARDVSGSCVRLSQLVSEVRIADMAGELEVTRPMLVALCDAILRGEFPPDELKTIGFALMASEHFTWDGDKDDLLASVIQNWSAPEINYPLTMQNIKRFKMWLLDERPYPQKPTAAATEEGRLYEVIHKRSIAPLRKRLLGRLG